MSTLYQNKDNWVLETYFDPTVTNSLKEIVNSNRDCLYENTESSAVRGLNSIQYWIYHHKMQPKFFDKTFEDGIKKLKEHVKSNLLQHNVIKDESLDYEGIWSIIGNEGSYCMIHDHTNISGISAVLYLQTPGYDPQHHLEDAQGQIYFVLNSDNSEDFESKVCHILPDVGKVLIFPNWLLHGTHPQAKGDRQTLNINFFTSYT